MDVELIREYCLLKKGTEECFPFDNNTLVFKVMGKVFLLLSLDAQPLRINAKCDPEQAIILRENNPNILPGYHMNKKHWNTIICDSSINQKLLKEWINHSYDLVIASLPKKIKQELLAF